MCRYEEYNCSLEVVAGTDMDGVTAVVEHLDLRGEEPEQWRDHECPDFIDIRSEQSMVRKPLCGQWDVERDHHLRLSGVEKNIIGYCVEDRSGHSCETKRILVDVAVEHNKTLSDSFPSLRKSDRHGFTIIFTAWRHADNTGSCDDSEMVCPNSDGGVHADRNHCIWQKMMCDGHQNCGFLVNKDEWGCRLGRETPWSVGTITVLVAIWIAIVTVLMLATVFLLQWNRISFRTPLDMLAESRQDHSRGGSPPVTERLQGGHVMSTASAPDPRTGGMVSIMVMYRPPNAGGQAGKTVDLPPTYESLYLGESPPGYNMLTVNIPSAEQVPGSGLSSRHETMESLSLQNIEITENNNAVSPDRVQSNLTHAIGILRRVASAQNTQIEVRADSTPTETVVDIIPRSEPDPTESQGLNSELLKGTIISPVQEISV